MKIAGLQKLTLLDYPEHLACIVFTQGCNFNCGYCQNSELINFNSDDLIDENEVLEFLKKRVGILSGVVISGGEPTIQKDLIDFIKKVKSLGYKVKLDTNGTNPEILKKLIDNELIDYIAMDIKHTFTKYEIVTCSKILKEAIQKSIKLVKTIPHEFRTTIIKGIHNEVELEQICEYLGKDETIYLQNFVMSEMVRGKSLLVFTNEELNNIKEKLNKKYPNVKVRL